MSNDKKVQAAPEVQTAVDPMEEEVDFIAPLDPTGRSMDVILGVNGETIRVKRGVPVKIKRKFLEVWNHSNEQAMAAQQVMAQAQEASRDPVAKM